MFTIVISEKGGAERRETFERNEINAGRVQGNDLMLPKGNVSKHHARLLYRDGRFIVTDLKSTNGTYVNGRKISQATIVREGDKIYIGDFVLRLEVGQRAPGAQSDAESIAQLPAHPGSGSRPSLHSTDDREAVAAPDSLPPRPDPAPHDDAASAVPMARPLPPPLPAAGVGPAPVEGSSSASSLPPLPSASPPRRAEAEVVSHYPLERDPDEPESSPDVRGASVSRFSASPRAEPHEPRGRGTYGSLAERSAARRAPAPRSRRSVPPPVPAMARSLLRESPQQAARRLALITLIDRVADVVDLELLEHSPVVADRAAQSIDRAVHEQAKAMWEEGEAPDGIDLELLARDAVRELIGLGPLVPLLEDDQVTEIHVVRPDCVLALRNGHTQLAEPSFTSEAAVARVVARLAHRSGGPLLPEEQIIDRRLPRGAFMTAIAPPASSGWALYVAKSCRIESTLSDLVRAGAMSDAMAAFLASCAAARANVIVAGSGGAAVATVLGAIASAAPPGERVAVLQQGRDDISVAEGHVFPLALNDHRSSGEQAVYAAARLGVDRLIVASLGGAVAVATIDVIAEGVEGVLAGVGAPSLGQGLGRLAAQIALARPGASVDSASEALAESFDVAVEVERRAGRLRVMRVAEIERARDGRVGARDLFVWSSSPTGDGSHAVAGTESEALRRKMARRVA
jgi:pilus assembly protein CpaF